MQNAFTSLEHVEDWFKKLGSIYYTLYRGKTKRIIYRQEIEGLDVDEAWESLRDIMKMQAAYGASFTLMVTSKPKFNVPMGEILVDLNNNQLPGIAGVPGQPNGISPAIGAEAIQSAIAKERMVWEMEKRIEDLEAAESSKISAVERIATNLIESGNLDQLLVALVSKIMPGPTPRTTIQGVPTAQPSSIEESLSKIGVVFPDVDQFLAQLSDWIIQNQEMAKQLFSSNQNVTEQ